MASPGSQGVGREQAKRDRATAERNGGGASALAVGATQNQTQRFADGHAASIAHDPITNALRGPGKPTGAGGGGQTQIGPEGIANPSSPAAPSTPAPAKLMPAFAPNGRPLTDGTIQTYDDPSLGQVVSALTRMPISPLGVISTLASVADSDQYGRDMLGRTIDEENGSTPDPGYQGPNRIASNTYSRGDNDTRLMDRASAAARAGLSDAAGGAAPADAATGGDDGGAEFSSVKLADRRRPYDDLSAVDLLRGLL